MATTKIRLALDWTPNTNHAPFLIAQGEGYYAAENLSVEFVDPSSDDYSKTPAARLAAGEVDLALAPSESVLAYRYGSRKTPLRAVATIFRHDVSCIATLRDRWINRPRDLDGKKYASYGARFEDEIVRELIRADGGEGNLEIVELPKTGPLNALYAGKADATWIFKAWEGLESEMLGIKLQYFEFKDYGIPYGYSPLLLENEDNKLPKEVLTAFLRASRKAIVDSYNRVLTDPGSSIRPLVAQELQSVVDVSVDRLLLDGAFAAVSAKGEVWGHMDPVVWESWIGWIKSKGLLTKRDGSEIKEVVDPKALYTNEYIDAI